MAKRVKVDVDSDLELAKALHVTVAKSGGDGSFISLEESIENLIGIPLLRRLPLQYIMGIDAFPLNRQFTVIGGWGSTKSSFCDEICALFQYYGGWAYYSDNEKKKNPIQTMAQFEWMLKWGSDRMVKVDGIAKPIPLSYKLIRPQSIDEMLKYMTAYLVRLKEHFQKYPDDIKKRAYILIIDSLFSLTSSKALNEMTEGVDPNNIANMQNASMNKSYITMVNQLIDKLPATIIFVNELNDNQGGIVIESKKGNSAPPVSKYQCREVGGRFKDFAYSGNFMLEKFDAGPQNSNWILGKDREVPHIRMNMKKAGFNVQRNDSIIVPYRTLWAKDENGEPKEYLWYDWDASLTHLLHVIIGPKKLAPHFDMVCEGGSYNSKALGLSGLSATQFGSAIHANPELVQYLQDEVFHIIHINKFTETPDKQVALPLGRQSNGEWIDPERVAKMPTMQEESAVAEDQAMDIV